MKYLAIGLWVDSSGQTFSLSRETTSTDPKLVAKYLKRVSKHLPGLDTILLVKSTLSSPEVIRHWTTTNGDF